MSKFFQALEQAERDRALRTESRQPAAEEAQRSVTAADEWAPRVPAPMDAGAARDTETSTEIDEHLVSILAPTSFAAEQYRALRHAVEQRHRADGLSIVGVSSAMAGDGKTTTAINLAGGLAQALDARVLLLEADVRCPSVANYLGLSDAEGAGLVDAISQAGIGLDRVVRRCPTFNLSVLPAGRRAAAAYELFKSSRLQALLDEAREQYDYVVVDTPPLLPAPDCRLLVKSIDAFILVVTAEKTPRKLVHEAVMMLAPDKILGFVFNGDRASKHYGGSEQHAGNLTQRWQGSIGAFWQRGPRAAIW